LWAAAIIAVPVIEGSLHFPTLATLLALWFSGNIILVRLSE